MDDGKSLQQLSNTECLLLLSRIKGIGPVRLNQLLDTFGSAKRLLNQDSQELLQYSNSKTMQDIALQLALVQQKGLNHPSIQYIKHALDYCHQAEINIIDCYDSRYPQLLSHCHGKPLILYVKGRLEYLSEPQLAIVGARNASFEGQKNSFQWARALAEGGLIITSGLAEGIDSYAHQGALSANKPTIAVLAHGLDQVYPKQHQSLLAEISESGLVISEFAIGERPQREYFPRRNRIISGLSLGVCIVEAALKSGSLITARYAIEQNREVFALPSTINNPRASGCHYLIKEGAQLVTEPEDILRALSICNSISSIAQHQTMSQKESILLDLIPYESTHFDQLRQQLDLSTEGLACLLMQWELEGFIRQDAGFYRRL